MQEYLKRYPWLKGSSEDAICSFEWLPKGWVIAFGEELCQELDIALRKTDKYHEAYVCEAKEKYGSLRLHLYPFNQEIEEIILKYEIISEHVCENCGAVDVPMLNIGGWFSPYCKTCYDEINQDNRFHSFEEAADGEMQMPKTRKWRRHSKDGWQDFEVDISETVCKIREKARREGRQFYEG